MTQSDTTPTSFRHDRRLYLSRVYGEGVVSLLAFLYTGYQFLTTNTAVKILWGLVAVVCAYSVYRLLISRSTPEVITIEDDQVTFNGLGKNKTYAIADLQEFLIKEFRTSSTQLIRVKAKNGRQNKYWVEWKAYNDPKVLEQKLLAIEGRVHPDELKAKLKAHNERIERLKSRNVSKRKK